LILGFGMPFCSKCGAEMADDARFCAKCGQTAAEPVRERRGEKDEKREKEEKGEKAEKREKEEKGEKQEGDRSGALVGGLIVILLGALILLSDQDMIPETEIWAYLLWGIGIILLAAGVLHFAGGRRPSATGYLIGGLVLCVLGAGGILGYENAWAVVIIVIGIGVVAIGLQARKRSPEPP
jgi:ribosomal protein L40E